MVEALIGCGVLLAFAVACAWLMRVMRCPGDAVVGGMLAGLLLGPSLLGRLTPATFERIAVGGITERVARDAVLREHGADLIVAEQMTLAGQDVTPTLERHAWERANVERALTDARWSHQRPYRVALAITIALSILLGSRITRRPDEPTPAAGSILGIAAGATLIPAGVVYAVLHFALDQTADASMLAAAAIAIGPYAMGTFDRAAANHAERGGALLVQSAGRVATVTALALAAGAWWHGGSPHAWLALTLLVLPVSWLLPSPRESRSRPAVERVLVPFLAALVAVRLELFHHFAIWSFLLLVLASSDGRWSGATIGVMLTGGRSLLRTMRLVLGSTAAGPTQLAITAVAVYTWTLPESLAMGLAAGVLAIEVTSPMRRRVGKSLEQTEEELERLRGPDD